MTRFELSETFAKLPPEWPDDPLPAIRDCLRENPAKLVVIDDDPTGSQTVFNMPVLTEWKIPELVDELRNDLPAFYILTNSRGVPLQKAREINSEIGRNLEQASRLTGRGLTVISRGDSTLRGHFPGEVEALVEGLQIDFDAWLIIPALISEGRYTLDDIHYVAEGGGLVPVGETAYARDATFGFHSSNLKDWVEEKTGGQVHAADVESISLDEIRTGGPARVREHLLKLVRGSICIVNAVSSRDLEVFTLGLMQAEAQGRRFLFRSGPSFVPARIGLGPYPLLTSASLPPADSSVGGLIIVGSYVPNTSRQVQILLQRGLVTSIEVEVERLLLPNEREDEVLRIARLTSRELAQGHDALVYTSRKLKIGTDALKSLEIGQMVSASLIAILDKVTVRPRYVLAKGGITSSDVATKGLGVKRAVVIGQVSKGVSVWQLGPESRYDGLLYVVFPGNVGEPETLAEAVSILSSEHTG